jgi:hypothetical protein
MKKLVIVAATDLALLYTVALGQTPSAPGPPANAISMPEECRAWVAKPTAVPSIREVKRVFVDSFGTDPVSAQIQAMVITQLLQSDRFVVTENRLKADAFLKGAGLEKTSLEKHSFETGTAAGVSSSGFSGSFSGGSGGFSGGSASAGAAINDAYSSTETVNDARVSVRMVNQEGDVLWATTQESKGAKYKGASADVADKVIKQLLRDIEKAEKKIAVSAN